MGKKKQKKWSRSYGDRPHTVTVYERKPGGNLYVRVWDPEGNAGEGKHIRRSLGHKDRERAIDYAINQAARLRKGQEELRRGKTRLGRIIALYKRHRTSRKSKRQQMSDRRRAELWTRFLGEEKDPNEISRKEWETFIELRRSGVLGPYGKKQSSDNQMEVRRTTVGKDCEWLVTVFNFAVKWRTNGYYLLKENPLRGFDVPTAKNPRQPVASRDRYEALREVSDDVTMRVSWDGEYRKIRSYLSEILDIAVGTGRRINAICSLRYSDVSWEKTKAAPYGSITWPAETDKCGKETTVPIGATVREALDRIRRERPKVGQAPLFPAPMDSESPIKRGTASKWLQRAEDAAGLDPQDGTAWHAFRRMWVTERKHLPSKDVATAGGWESGRTVERIYQQADEETMLEVVTGHRELREVK